MQGFRFRYLATLLAALAVVPGGAHLLAMPNKLAMAQPDYAAAQAAYSGWALLGVVLVGSLVVDLALAYRLRRDRGAALLALAAATMMALSLAVFFTWVFPANQATQNWTVVPPERWEQLRLQWELGHAAGAVLDFLAFCAVAAAALRTPAAP